MIAIKKEQMKSFGPNPVLDEIFSSRNLDAFCEIIGRMLDGYGERVILSALEDWERCPVGAGMTGVIGAGHDKRRDARSGRA